MGDVEQHGVDMHDAQQDRRARDRHYVDTSAEAETDWRAQSEADAYEESGGTYREGLAALRRDCPWLFDHNIPEPSDSRPGDDPKLTETEVDHPTLPHRDIPWQMAG